MFHSIDDINDVAAKTAAHYLGKLCRWLSVHSQTSFNFLLPDLILSATRNSPESLGLCFDELAAVLSHRNSNHRKKLTVNKSFEIWISDFIVDHFQDLFVVDELPNIDVECEYQYSINSSEDNNTCSEDVENIGINIAGLTFKPSSKYCSLSVGRKLSIYFSNFFLLVPLGPYYCCHRFLTYFESHNIIVMAIL